jgi:hypothetical protein
MKALDMANLTGQNSNMLFAATEKEQGLDSHVETMQCIALLDILNKLYLIGCQVLLLVHSWRGGVPFRAYALHTQ